MKSKRTAGAAAVAMLAFACGLSSNGAKADVKVVPSISKPANPQYSATFNTANCGAGFATSADSCSIHNSTGALQGIYNNGVVSMQNNEDWSKVKTVWFSVVLNGAFPNGVKNNPTVTPKWSDPPPLHSFVGYTEFSHPLPNTFVFLAIIRPQSASETIDLNTLVVIDGATDQPLPFTPSLLVSIDVATVCEAVPEPESWALMLLGGAGAFYLGHRRRKQTGPATLAAA